MFRELVAAVSRRLHLEYLLVRHNYWHQQAQNGTHYDDLCIKSVRCVTPDRVKQQLWTQECPTCTPDLRTRARCRCHLLLNRQFRLHQIERKCTSCDVVMSSLGVKHNLTTLDDVMYDKLFAVHL